MGSDAGLQSFDLLGLSHDLLQAVADAGYTTPTPIQRQAIPAVLQGRDVLGIAQTGTGKTASFTLPMIDILAQGRTKARMPRSLILEPTRELAAQVADNFEVYGRNHKLTMALLIGGVSFADQEAKLERGVDVLIATPGRLLDHFGRGKLMLNGVSVLVVDEADRMMDMGFIPDVERIFKLMPQQHQTLFFSATMPKTIKRLTDQFLKDPKTIEVAPPASAAETVTQRLVTVAPRNKMKALKAVLAEADVTTAIVFCNRKRDVATVTTGLKREGHPVGQLHGDMSQPERMETLQKLRDDEISVLVASDVAARGLDIAAVSHVINFDVPNNSDDYVHRIGRTGRAGRSGTAVTIATKDDQRMIDDIRKALGVGLEAYKPEGVPAARDTGQDEPEAAAEAQSKAPQADKAPESTGEPDKKSGSGRRRRPKPSGGDAPSDGGQGSERKDHERQDRERHDRERQDRERQGSERQSGDRKGRERPAGKKGGDDQQVVGLGDHVPAFLLRPVPKRSKTAGDEDEVGEGEEATGGQTVGSDDAASAPTPAPKKRGSSRGQRSSTKAAAKSGSGGRSRSRRKPEKAADAPAEAADIPSTDDDQAGSPPAAEDSSSS